MIEKALRAHLKESTPITTIVGMRIYAGNAPRGVNGPYILLRRIAAEHFYDLGGEVIIQNPIVQIDCYEATKTGADDLAEKVRNRISGFRGYAGGVQIQTCKIVRDTTLEVPPADASDQWIYMRSVDLEVFESLPVPTFD